MPKKSVRNANTSQNDGFPILKVENWYFDKLKIIQSYLKAYHKRFDLRNKNKMLVYIGSGPGIVQLDDKMEVPGTPLEILGMSNSFQRYVFCEKNPEYAKALKVRVGRDYPEQHAIFIEGDINETIEKLPPYLPEKINKSQTAVLCIIDVQSFDVNFETIEMLSAMDVEFILVNSYVHTAYYNYKFYLEEERELMNAYFGMSWARLAESSELKSDTSFFLLVIKAYLEQIRHLGYNVTGTLHKYNLDKSLVPYYQIAYCSKSKTLNSLKKSMVSEASKQTELFGDE